MLRERDLAGAKLREEHFRAEADVRAQALRADHACQLCSELERQVGELQAQLTSHEARHLEDRRALHALTGRLERRALELEGEVASERKRLEGERKLRDAGSEDLRLAQEKFSQTVADQLRAVRETAAAQAQLAASQEKVASAEKDFARGEESGGEWWVGGLYLPALLPF